MLFFSPMYNKSIERNCYMKDKEYLLQYNYNLEICNYYILKNDLFNNNIS